MNTNISGPQGEGKDGDRGGLEAGRIIRDIIRQHRFNVTGREWEDLTLGQQLSWAKVAEPLRALLAAHQPPDRSRAPAEGAKPKKGSRDWFYWQKDEIKCQVCGNTELENLPADPWCGRYRCNACGTLHDVSFGDRMGGSRDSVSWYPAETSGASAESPKGEPSNNPKCHVCGHHHHPEAPFHGPAAPGEPSTPEPGAEPSLREIGLIYNLGAAMVKIGSLGRFLKLAESKCADKHNACVYCARFLPSGHAENCPLVEALEEFKAAPASSREPGAGKPEVLIVGLPPREMSRCSNCGKYCRHCLGNEPEASREAPAVEGIESPSAPQGPSKLEVMKLAGNAMAKDLERALQQNFELRAKLAAIEGAAPQSPDLEADFAKWANDNLRAYMVGPDIDCRAIAYGGFMAAVRSLRGGAASQAPDLSARLNALPFCPHGVRIYPGNPCPECAGGASPQALEDKP